MEANPSPPVFEGIRLAPIVSARQASLLQQPRLLLSLRVALGELRFVVRLQQNCLATIPPGSSVVLPTGSPRHPSPQSRLSI